MRKKLSPPKEGCRHPCIKISKYFDFSIELFVRMVRCISIRIRHPSERVGRRLLRYVSGSRPDARTMTVEPWPSTSLLILREYADAPVSMDAGTGAVPCDRRFRLCNAAVPSSFAWSARVRLPWIAPAVDGRHCESFFSAISAGALTPMRRPPLLWMGGI